jgi:hypothetical protein
MSAQVIFRTQGVATSFVNTTNRIPIFLTSGIATRFLNTFQPTPFFQTGGVSSSFLTTNVSLPLFLTPSEAVSFFTTADRNTTKLLVPKIGTMEISSGYTFVNVPDATGDYNVLTNPGGYNILPLPFNAARPYRENVALWTVYRIWNVYGSDTQSPDEQNEQYDNPYEYQLFFPTQTNAAQEEEVIRGVYEIILIAAPYFNETDTGGVYAGDSFDTYNLIYGTDTDFTTSLLVNDYLYYVDGTTGDLIEMEQVAHVFSDTLLNLSGIPNNYPAEPSKLYGSVAQITTAINSGGTVDTFTSAEYTPVQGTGTSFNLLTEGNILFYVEAATGDYKPMGAIFDVISQLNINIINPTENVATNGDVLVAYTTDSVPVINSGGTFDNEASLTITGTGTLFLTNFTIGQTLYYQDAATGALADIGVIDSIIDDVTLTVVSIVNTPTLGDRLFAGDAGINVETTSGGTFDTYNSIGTYYTLTGAGVSFGPFSPADYIYIVTDSTYELLGQVAFIENSTSMVFYSAPTIDVPQGSFIIGSSVALILKDVSGAFESYDTGTYYEVTGTGTTFLTTAEPNQYLFYEDSTSGLFIVMGKIFQVFDNTTIWLFEAPTGTADSTTQLFTSYSLNTETALYADYRGIDDLYEIANQFPGWFVGSAGLIVDELLINCLSRLRYEFLQGVMCGRCDEGYLHTYSLYVGMLNAMEVGEWLLAVDFYNKLKVICAEQDGSSCGC